MITLPLFILIKVHHKGRPSVIRMAIKEFLQIGGGLIDNFLLFIIYVKNLNLVINMWLLARS